MDEAPFDTDSAPGIAVETGPLEAPLLAASEPFVGRWTRLISTTNWEKGRIITQWREALQASGTPVTAYSDETWSRLVGAVTGQHVGRLRRVFQRFGTSFQDYAGLYWSHFFAASDWNDGEMWLEGAVQSRWSVSQMRNQRWETLGQLAADQPRAEDVIAADKDEDLESSPAREALPPSVQGSYDEVQGPLREGPDWGDDSEGSSRSAGEARESASQGESSSGPSVELVRPFADLPDLPPDLADAFDQFKLALLHHKTDGWRDVSSAAALQALDALKSLVTAPSSSESAV